MDKKLISISLVTLVVAGTLGFFGGMKYAQSKGSSVNPSFAQGVGQNRMMGGLQSGTKRVGAGPAGGFVSGDILSKDDKSITVKMRDGSSKIVFYSGTTSVGKAVAGTAADLVTGQQVTVSGTTNSDGSVTAQQIQIRPEGSPTPVGAPAK